MDTRKPMGHAADGTPVYMNERSGAIHFGCTPTLPEPPVRRADWPLVNCSKTADHEEHSWRARTWRRDLHCEVQLTAWCPGVKPSKPAPRLWWVTDQGYVAQMGGAAKIDRRELPVFTQTVVEHNRAVTQRANPGHIWARACTHPKGLQYMVGWQQVCGGCGLARSIG